MIIYLAVIGVLIAFLIGFIYGRRKGKREGLAEGELYAPLQLRIKGLQKGRCQICGTKVIKRVKSLPHCKNSRSC